MKIVEIIKESSHRRLGAQRAQLLWQLVKFAFVGVMNTLITLAVIYVLMYMFALNYRYANLAGYIVGLINSFVWSKLWVFGKKDGGIGRQMSFFLINFAICYLLQFGVLTLMVEQMQIGEGVAQLIAMVVYTLVNFVINKTITFK